MKKDKSIAVTPAQNRSLAKQLEHKFRSMIISKAIEVEKWIEEIIILRFMDINRENLTEVDKFNYYFFEDGGMLTFNNKKDILRRIILTEKLLTNTDRKKLDTEIQKIGSLRNHVAHLPTKSLMLSDAINFDGTTIEFSYNTWEGDSSINKSIKINEEIIENEIKSADDIITKLRLITKLLAEKHKTKAALSTVS